MSSDKATKAQAQYQGRPMLDERCELCEAFRAPQACEWVEGLVSKRGWCRLFEPAKATKEGGEY